MTTIITDIDGEDVINIFKKVLWFTKWNPMHHIFCDKLTSKTSEMIPKHNGRIFEWAWGHWKTSRASWKHTQGVFLPWEARESED